MVIAAEDVQAAIGPIRENDVQLSAYLQRYFVDKPTFATQCGITMERLDELLSLGAIPAATYSCDGRSIHSAVFGAIATEEPLEGDFFRPECTVWAKLADQAMPGHERETVLAEFENQLRVGLSTYLNDGAMIEDWIRDFIPSFLDGTFGLCVANPSKGACIARKEFLQDRLTELTANGSNPAPEGISSGALLQLIDDYAAAMPFSPAEYARSSRKRLVDDLRSRVAEIAQVP